MEVAININTEKLIFIEKFDMPAEIERIEYDPNRSCHIMLVKFEDGERAYYLAPQQVKVEIKFKMVQILKLKLKLFGITGYSCWYKYT